MADPHIQGSRAKLLSTGPVGLLLVKVGCVFLTRTREPRPHRPSLGISTAWLLLVRQGRSIPSAVMPQLERVALLVLEQLVLQHAVPDGRRQR